MGTGKGKPLMMTTNLFEYKISNVLNEIEHHKKRLDLAL